MPLPRTRAPASVALAADTPAETATLADQAHAQLKQLIFDFALMPGDRCSESELAQRLAITKTARVAATYDEHARILGAITRRRADEAQRLLRAHIAQSKTEVRHITLDMLYRARRQA